MRVGMLGLGAALGILWLGGLESAANEWLTWIDLLCATGSVAAGAAPAKLLGPLRAAPLVIGMTLVIAWVVGIALEAAAWLTWWNFAFGVTYLVYGIALRRLSSMQRPSRA
jgi:hypothetical protein